MFKTLHWNVISIKTNSALERIKHLITTENLLIIALSDPFYKAHKIDKYKRTLGYHHAFSMCNSQIWIFWEENLECDILDDYEQQVTCSIKFNGVTLLLTYVYVKCEDHPREELWDRLRYINGNFNLPWLVVGDFNCITDPAENKGGTPHRMSKSLAFIQCIMDCNLFDAGYSDPNFTWCNG